MTLIKERYNEALAKKNNINTYIWKGPKVNDVQEEIKLIDCDFDQLKKFYNHCEQMLYNKDAKYPGRVVLQDIVSEQIQKCKAELLIRWMRSERDYTATACLEDLRTVLSNNKDIIDKNNPKTCYISNFMSNLPIEFDRVPIQFVMDACLDYLGVINLSHLTLNFIIKMGLYFTNQEMQKDLYKKDPITGKTMDRREVIKQELRLDPKIELRICPTGLTYAEFKTMYKLRRDKYSNLTSDQLRLLSNKVLQRFRLRCEEQAQQWRDKQKEIIEVASSKGWDVTRNIDA